MMSLHPAARTQTTHASIQCLTSTPSHCVALHTPLTRTRPCVHIATQAARHRSRRLVCNASISDAIGVGLFFAPSIAILAYSYIRGKGMLVVD